MPEPIRLHFDVKNTVLETSNMAVINDCLLHVKYFNYLVNLFEKEIGSL